MSDIHRLFIEKKPGFDLEARAYLNAFTGFLTISSVQSVRLFYRYDVSGVTSEIFHRARATIFSDPVQDQCYDEQPPDVVADMILGMEYLPGQYDQRADSAEQCLRILDAHSVPHVRTAKIVYIRGTLTDEDKRRIRNFCINPVDSREARLDKPPTLEQKTRIPRPVPQIEGFITADNEQLSKIHKNLALVMDVNDLLFCQTYFRETAKRNPTVTELKMLDTYWSDHCRHTTFLTEITSVTFDDVPEVLPIKEAYRSYLHKRETFYEGRERPDCLMDLATIAMKSLKREGRLPELELSDEINACTIRITVPTSTGDEEWLVLFKNETHNHPTEIEPFGGAATCLGGAIRDPLSGRAYVYQAMRISGSADPRQPISETLPGKLPQRTITTQAARGFSSYGNQIGLNTGLVREIYHPGYRAKRMEVGAVIGAVPASQVRREKPTEGDWVVLLGGGTGRDGIGGATGSSRAHDDRALENSAEVQKGNAPEERKLQRLFACPEFTRCIKKSNDFGAGGVSVAVGELAESLDIFLDALPKKYEGLDGTELALSESQERMAIVIGAKDYEKVAALARKENVRAVKIARVTSSGKLRMFWRDQTIVDIDRAFLDSNGLRRKSRVHVQAPSHPNYFEREDFLKAPDHPQNWYDVLTRLDSCSQRGLIEQFDNSIGSLNVLSAFGGKNQATPSETMVSLLPFTDSEKVTAMSWGFDPYLSEWSPFHGGAYAVLDSVAKQVALGIDFETIYFSFQEYFEKLGDDPKRWGKTYAALLGANQALDALGRAAIGGKDSMSGSFKNLDVPPTLISFAVGIGDARIIVSNELKKAGHILVFFHCPLDENHLPIWESLKKAYKTVHALATQEKVFACQAIDAGGLSAALMRMAFGNLVGMEIENHALPFFIPLYGSLILETDGATAQTLAQRHEGFVILGKTTTHKEIQISGQRIDLVKALNIWEEPLESIFPTRHRERGDMEIPPSAQPDIHIHSSQSGRPRVVLPVFPGTNCEYDSERAWKKAGAVTSVFLFRTLDEESLQQSLTGLAEEIRKSQIIMLPGGFSAGDEPEGSGKYIATVFRNPVIRDAVMELLTQRDGLILGICNGFQALVRLGLLPYGHILDQLPEEAPTLAFNRLNRHHATYVTTRVLRNDTPWTSGLDTETLYRIPISNGEGRFYAQEKMLKEIIDRKQVITQYVDDAGHPSMHWKYNPSGSLAAIEGIVSPDGRVLGKMGHSERSGDFVAKNIPDKPFQDIFSCATRYFG